MGKKKKNNKLPEEIKDEKKEVKTEEKKVEKPEEEKVEEPKEEKVEEVKEEVTEEPVEEVKEEPKEEPKPEPKKDDVENKLGAIKVIVIIIIGILCYTGSFLVTYNLFKEDEVVEEKEEKKEKKDKKEKKEDTKKEEDYLTVGKYKLKYGTYKGINKQYDETTGKTKDVEMTLELTKTKITTNGVSNSYVTKSDGYIYINNTQMYEVTGDNKMTLLAGAGVEFEFYK